MSIEVKIISEGCLSDKPACVLIYEDGELITKVIATIHSKPGPRSNEWHDRVTLEKVTLQADERYDFVTLEEVTPQK